MFLNLRAAARPLLVAVQPEESVVFYRSAGRENRRGTVVPLYDPPLLLPARIQSLAPDELHDLEDAARTAVRRKAWLPVEASGIVRDLGRGGDLLRRADGSWWLVSALLEDFFASSGWVAVRITRQLREETGEEGGGEGEGGEGGVPSAVFSLRIPEGIPSGDGRPPPARAKGAPGASPLRHPLHSPATPLGSRRTGIRASGFRPL